MLSQRVKIRRGKGWGEHKSWIGMAWRFLKMENYFTNMATSFQNYSRTVEVNRGGKSTEDRPHDQTDFI